MWTYSLWPAASAFAALTASGKQLGGKAGIMGKVSECGMYNKPAEQAAKAKEKDIARHRVAEDSVLLVPQGQRQGRLDFDSTMRHGAVHMVKA
jgi:hypothetical protein